MTHTVTRLFLTPLLTGLLGVGEAFPQASDDPAGGSIRLGLSAGITSFALGFDINSSGFLGVLTLEVTL